MDEFVEKYVRMCQEAKEIQDTWKPKSGDCVGRKGTFDYDYIPQIGAGDNYAEDIIEFGMWGDGDYFIPRQEDLQETYMKENPCSHLSTVFTCFRYWYKEVYAEREGYGEQHYWNILWLEFVMWKCFEKEWDKTSGTWVKRLD